MHKISEVFVAISASLSGIPIAHLVAIVALAAIVLAGWALQVVVTLTKRGGK